MLHGLAVCQRDRAHRGSALQTLTSYSLLTVAVCQTLVATALANQLVFSRGMRRPIRRYVVAPLSGAANRDPERAKPLRLHNGLIEWRFAFSSRGQCRPNGERR